MSHPSKPNDDKPGSTEYKAWVKEIGATNPDAPSFNFPGVGERQAIFTLSDADVDLFNTPPPQPTKQACECTTNLALRADHRELTRTTPELGQINLLLQRAEHYPDKFLSLDKPTANDFREYLAQLRSSMEALELWTQIFWGLDGRRKMLCRCTWALVGCCISKVVPHLETIEEELQKMAKKVPAVAGKVNALTELLDRLTEETNLELTRELMADVEEAGGWRYELDEVYIETLKKTVSG